MVNWLASLGLKNGKMCSRVPGKKPNQIVPQSFVSNHGCYLGGAFNLLLMLTLILGEDSHFDELICFSWVG